MRHGVTVGEEQKLKQLVSKGVTWEGIVARCQVTTDGGQPQVPLLADVDMGYVQKHFFEPLVEAHEDAKKAGFKSILNHDKAKAAAKKKTADEKKAKEE